MADEPSPPKPKKKRNLKGLLKVLTILVVVCSAPVIAVIVMNRIDHPPKPTTAEAEAAAAEAKGEAGGHGGAATVKSKLPPEIAVPLANGAVAALDAPKMEDAQLPRVVMANATSIKRQEITAILADKGPKPHYAVAEIFLTSNDTEGLIAQLNATQPALFNRVKAYLEERTLKQIKEITFMTNFKNDLQQMCKDILGDKVVKDVIVAEFKST